MQNQSDFLPLELLSCEANLLLGQPPPGPLSAPWDLRGKGNPDEYQVHSAMKTKVISDPGASCLLPVSITLAGSQVSLQVRQNHPSQLLRRRATFSLSVYQRRDSPAAPTPPHHQILILPSDACSAALSYHHSQPRVQGAWAFPARGRSFHFTEVLRFYLFICQVSCV